MADLNAAIKAIIKNYINNMSMSNLAYGTYISGGLKLDDKPITIGCDMVRIGKSLEEGENPLKSGDRVAVLQAQGGQSYYILDRL